MLYLFFFVKDTYLMKFLNYLEYDLEKLPSYLEN